MKELVTLIIPVSTPELSAPEAYCLRTYQEHLSGFPITFIGPEPLKKSEVYRELCPEADYVALDDRYFVARGGLAKLLLNSELYEQFSWSRYLLVGNLTTRITKNELAYWCRQGYDLVQQFPSFEKHKNQRDYLTKRLNPSGYLATYQAQTREFDRTGGFSLRKVDTMAKLVKKKKRAIHNFFTSNPTLDSDALFWEYYANRWTPELLVPNTISRDRFADSGPFASTAEMPFAITGIETVTSK